MKKIKKFICLLLVVCFSVTAFPNIFASAAETSYACPFELGDTITFKSNDSDDPYLVYDNPLMQAPDIKFLDGTEPENEFEVIDVCDDGSFCLGIENLFGMSYNICATRKGLEAKPYQDPTNFVLEDAGNGQYYLKANEGDYKGQYLYQYQSQSSLIYFKSNSKTPLTISKNGEQIQLYLNPTEFTITTVEGAAITYQSTSSNTVKIVSGPGVGYSGALTIPNKVEYDGVEYTVTGIGSYAFIYYEKLTTVTLPDTIKAIDNGAFSCCKFDKMVVDCQTPPELGQGVFDNSMEFELVVPSGTEDAYKAAGWPI